MTTTRRDFLKQSAGFGAIIATPTLWARPARAADANSRPTIASIGVGGSRGRYSRGGDIARQAAELGQMIAVCDVDDLHTEEFNAEFDGKLNMYRDYRVLFEQERPDVVTIGTPDHWHTPIALTALRSGCDVYCEKPLTLTIDEGIQIRKAVEETGRVFQVGTQQRSEYDQKFLKAIAIVQSGRLGSNVNAYLAIGAPPDGPDQPFPTLTPPPNLDWDMWLGPAPATEYCDERRLLFRWFYEYSGGKMTDWGAHHIDIAQWAIGADHTGPTSVGGTGQFPPIVPNDLDWAAFLDGEVTLPNSFNTAKHFSIDLNFANGSTINVNHHYQRDDGTDFGNGILFEGDAGRIFVNRERLSGKPVEELTEADNAELQQRIIELYKGKEPGDHMQNFFECLETREQPIADIATHQRTMSSCHLCNISLMLGRDLTWDPEKEEFVGDDQASALTSRKSRPGYGPTG